MRPFTQTGLSTAQVTSTGTGDVKTITAPKYATAAFISVETTNARVTFDGSTPSATNGIVVQKDQTPMYVPVGRGTTISVASTAAANSVVSVAWLR